MGAIKKDDYTKSLELEVKELKEKLSTEIKRRNIIQKTSRIGHYDYDFEKKEIWISPLVARDIGIKCDNPEGITYSHEEIFKLLKNLSAEGKISGFDLNKIEVLGNLDVNKIEEKYQNEFSISIEEEKYFYRNVMKPCIENGKLTNLLGVIVDITELAMSKDLLLESTSQLHKTERLSQSGSFSLDIKSDMLTVTENFCDVLGLSKDIKKITHSDFAQACDTCFVIRNDKYYNGKTTLTSELFGINDMDIKNLDEEYFVYVDLSLNSEWKYLRVYYTPIIEKNAIVGINAIGTDITDIKKKERALSISKSVLERAEEVSKAGSWILDMKTMTYTLTANLCRLIGIGSEELTLTYEEFTQISQERVNAVVVTEDKTIPYTSLFTVIEAAGNDVNDITTLKAQYSAVIKSGDTYLESLYTPIIANGELVSFVGLSRDISESKQLEQNLLKEKNRLEKTEEVSGAGNFTFDFKSNMFTFSPNFCKVVGLGAEENRMTYDEYCAMTTGSYVTKENGVRKLYSDYKTAWDNMIGDAIKESYFVKVELNDNLGYVNATYYPVYRDGELVGVEGLIRDVTKDMEHEKELISALEKAKEATAQQSRFVANMSHEIRTPLNAILGYAEIMKEQNDNKKLDHYLKSIDIAGNSLLSLINDILDFSKVKANKFTANYIPAILGDFLEEIKILFYHKINQKNLDFEIFYDSELPTLMLPSATIRQILINLVGNAIKFTNSGGIYIKANARDNNNGTYNVDIEVKDTGIGVPQEKQDLIFREFEQADTSHEKVGTGLGLALSVNFAKLIGGNITLESVDGEGSAFTLHVKNIALASSEIQAMHKGHNNTAVKFFGQRALVLDDIKDNREVLSAHCKFVGLEPKAFETGAEALYNLNIFKPDIILTDLRMPEMNGEEFANNVKALEEFRDLPIICITASINPEENYHLQNFDDVLNKPISSTKLSRAISKYLDFEQIEGDETEDDEFHLQTAFRNLKMTDDDFQRFKSDHHEDIKMLKIAMKPKIVAEGSDLLIQFGTDTKNDLLVSIGENLRNYCNALDIVNMMETVNQMLMFLERD